MVFFRGVTIAAMCPTWLRNSWLHVGLLPLSARFLVIVFARFRKSKGCDSTVSGQIEPKLSFFLRRGYWFYTFKLRQDVTSSLVLRLRLRSSETH